MSILSHSIDYENAIKRKEIIDSLHLLTTTDEDKHLQDITTSVAFTANCTMAYFSLFTDNKQIIKSSFGFVPARFGNNIPLFDSLSCELGDSICCLTMKLSPAEPLIILDTHQRSELISNRFVVGPPYLRYYVGLPIKYKGVNIGTLCAGDTSPKSQPSYHTMTSLHLLKNKLIDVLIDREQKHKSKKWFNIFNF